MKLLREIDQRGWLTIGLAVAGNVIIVIGGLAGNAVLSMLILAAVATSYVFIYQLGRTLFTSTLELAQESTRAWQVELDFSRELIDDYVGTIHDLSRLDPQSGGIHLERLRTTMIKRYPEMKDEIAHVQHPLNMPGIVI